MARVRFLGDSPACAWLGVTFVHGEWVEAHGLDAGRIARLDNHPHFEVEAAAAPPIGRPGAKRTPPTPKPKSKA